MPYQLRRLPMAARPLPQPSLPPPCTTCRLLRRMAIERFHLFAIFLYVPRPAVLLQAR